MIDSSPCIADKRLFFGGRDGILYVFGSREDDYLCQIK
jgi:hypothetical protein